MATTDLGSSNIVAFVDSNTKVHGRLLGGIQAVAPTWLATRNEPILISSRVFQREIVTQIRETMQLPNRLISLYDEAQVMLDS